MLPYVRPEIIVMDIQQKTNECGIHYMNFYRSHKAVLHELFYFTQKPKKIELGDAWGTNPYHLFFYMLARFYYVDDGVTDIVFYYPKKELDFFTEGALAALPSRFKRELVKDDTYEYIELPACLWYNDSIGERWIYTYMRDLYKHIGSSIQQKGKYTYIIRDPVSSNYRRILNHKEVITIAKQEGFSIYEMGNLTFVEQIRLFRSSEFILGVHGAAFSFLVFCEPGTQVLEIYPNRPGKNHFYDISRKMNLKYDRFIALDSFNEENEDLVVNLSQFRNDIRHLIRTRCESLF
jgi:hypothetical protein